LLFIFSRRPSRAGRDGHYKLHYLDTRPLEHIIDRWLRTNKEETT
jgi:hypothetical protein